MAAISLELDLPVAGRDTVCIACLDAAALVRPVWMAALRRWLPGCVRGSGGSRCHRRTMARCEHVRVGRVGGGGGRIARPVGGNPRARTRMSVCQRGNGCDSPWNCGYGCTRIGPESAAPSDRAAEYTVVCHPWAGDCSGGRFSRLECGDQQRAVGAFARLLRVARSRPAPASAD